MLVEIINDERRLPLGPWLRINRVPRVMRGRHNGARRLGLRESSSGRRSRLRTEIRH